MAQADSLVAADRVAQTVLDLAGGSMVVAVGAEALPLLRAAVEAAAGCAIALSTLSPALRIRYL